MECHKFCQSSQNVGVMTCINTPFTTRIVSRAIKHECTFYFITFFFFFKYKLVSKTYYWQSRVYQAIADVIHAFHTD